MLTLTGYLASYHHKLKEDPKNLRAVVSRQLICDRVRGNQAFGHAIDIRVWASVWFT